MKNFGFGCMRLPMINGEVDTVQFSKMIDKFLQEGFIYFDTAHGYLDGKSEIAIRECLTSRYPRESYILTDKLSENLFKKNSDIRPMFESQLKACGVEYFDYYLMHAQNRLFYRKYIACDAYKTALELKKEGKIKHFGISFHDKARVLDKILSEQPEIEVVQIQFNYSDYDSFIIESRKCYEVCRKYNKQIIVMEPVRGGSLANLNVSAKKVLEPFGGSCASFAIRFAASFDGVMMVLSGMSNLEQMDDNISFMKYFKPLSEGEFAAIEKVKEILKQKSLVPCTACNYCAAGCPKQIPISDIFACFNAKKRDENWTDDLDYMVNTQKKSKASDCIGCGKCEQVCPQKIKIRKQLKKATTAFDEK